MTVVCDCRPFVFEKQFVCLCFSISDGAFNIGCDANLYQNGANKFPASCFIIVHNTGPINIAGCNLLCCPGVSIIFKIRVFYKARFEGFEFFLRWPYAVFHKMQVVFYKSAHFMYL